MFIILQLQAMFAIWHIVLNLNIRPIVSEYNEPMHLYKLLHEECVRKVTSYSPLVSRPCSRSYISKD
jgi:hypothetical protein